MARAAWILRAGRDDEYEHQAIGQSVIALGWRRIGDLSGLSSLTAINRLVDDAYTEFSARSRRVYGVQLYAFRCRVQVGDYVVLLRGNTPDVAVGTVTGDYAYRPDKPAHHLRPVTWARTDVRRAEIGADLLTAPALTNIFKIGRTDATARLKAVIAGIDQTPSSEAPPLPAASTPSTAAVQAPLTALENLRRNLEYALSLATAGLHLQQLKVGSFEVCDVFRAAWVQTVAALDHWVHQEIHQRMVAIADTSPGPRTVEFERLKLPIALVEKIAARTLTVREAVDQHFPAAFGQRTFQQPNRISEGLVRQFRFVIHQQMTMPSRRR